jgi:hypothetical protein
MAKTFSYRPKRYSVDELKNFAESRHTNLNRMIEEALLDRIQSEKQGSNDGHAEVLARKITRVIVDHMGVRLRKPSAATKAKILKKARENDEKGSWISDEAARPGRRHK